MWFKTISRFTIKILLWLTVLFAFIWVGSQIAVKVWGFPQTVIFVSNLVGVDPDFFVDTQGTGIENPTLNFAYETSYNVFFVASFIAGFGGVIILSHGRSFPEIMWLFTAFILPRQRKYWGKIYDKHTGKNLPFATIRLLDKETAEFLAQAISDLDGSYRIAINDRSKKYILEISAQGYEIEKVEVDPNNMQIVNKSLVIDIGLNPIGKLGGVSTWSSLRTKLYRPTILFVFIMSLLSLFFGIYGIISYPDSLPNQVSLVLAVVAVGWNISVLRQRFMIPSGSVLDAETKQPLQNVQLKIFDQTQQLVSTQTDTNGIAKINLPAGDYRLQLVKAGYKQEGGEFINIKINKKGFIADNIFMHRSGEAAPAEASDLLNPFS